MTLVCKETITRIQKNGDEKQGYYLDSNLKKNIDFEIKRINKNWDSVLLIDGEEGAAKTTLGSSIAYYLSEKTNTKFDLNDIFYTVEQFEKWLEEQPVGSVGLWDEFVLAGLSTEALTKIQNTLIKRMTLIRRKRLIIILVVPYIFMLRRYFTIGRTRCLIHVYSQDNLKRGTFMYFSKPNKKMLYFKGIKYWSYGVWKPDFIGQFTDTYGLFFDKDEYEKKKDSAMQSLSSDVRADKWRIRFCKFIREEFEKGRKWKDLAKQIGLEANYLSKFVANTLENAGFKARSCENKPIISRKDQNANEIAKEGHKKEIEKEEK